MISFSVAFDPNKGIGKNGKLPWHIKEELQVFKRNTLNKNILMGQTTYDNMPGKLKDRHTIVVSIDQNYKVEDPDSEVIYDLIAFLKKHQYDETEYVICGGASIYKQAYPYASKAYVSFIKDEYEVDTYFDTFDLNDWDITKEEEHEEFIERELVRKNKEVKNMKEKKDYTLIETIIAYVGSFGCFFGLAIGCYSLINIFNASDISLYITQIIEIVMNMVVLLIAIIYYMKGYHKKDAVWYRYFMYAFAIAGLVSFILSYVKGGTSATLIYRASNIITCAMCIYLAMNKNIGKTVSLIVLGVIALIYLYFLLIGKGLIDFAMLGVRFLISIIGIFMCVAKYVDKEKRYEKKGKKTK